MTTKYENIPKTAKIIDLFLIFTVATGVVQFVYMLLIGSYPLHSFLASFGCSVGMFVVGANLRLQMEEKAEKAAVKPQRLFSLTKGVSRFCFLWPCSVFLFHMFDGLIKRFI